MRTKLLFSDSQINLDIYKKVLEKKYKSFDDLHQQNQKSGCGSPDKIDDYMLWQAIINHEKQLEQSPILSDQTTITRFIEEITNHTSDPYSILTPRRMELLEYVHKNNPVSVKELAAELKRDYKNVYDDLLALQKYQLLEFVREGKNKRPVSRLTAIEILWDK
jgi:predicted transcriptional regulator